MAPRRSPYVQGRGDILSVADAVRGIRDERGSHRLQGTYLRGHASSGWALVPSIGRRKAYSHGGKVLDRFTRSLEKLLLHRFRRYAYTTSGRILTEWEVLFLARHHGLPVRLLDWTQNPLVALYWACMELADQDGVLWVLHRSKAAEEFLDVFDARSPLSIQGVRLVYPFYPTPRLIAQAGVFTIHQDPWLRLCSAENLRRYSKRCFDILCLERWRIPAGSKLSILEELERLGINERGLLPDLQGLAAGLWKTDVLRHGK